jgi:hypothetical protein
MNIKGNIKSIGEVQEFGNNGFRKKDVIIQEEGEYGQTFCVEFVKDKIEELTGNLTEGQFIDVDTNVRSKEWTNENTGKTSYFVSFSAWRINTEESQSAPQSAVNTHEANQGTKDEDDLPF